MTVSDFEGLQAYTSVNHLWNEIPNEQLKQLFITQLIKM